MISLPFSYKSKVLGCQPIQFFFTFPFCRQRFLFNIIHFNIGNTWLFYEILFRLIATVWAFKIKAICNWEAGIIKGYNANVFLHMYSFSWDRIYVTENIEISCS